MADADREFEQIWLLALRDYCRFAADMNARNLPRVIQITVN
ncbi:MAG: hypothetical protein QM696_12235 [Steroidobacteraceae bacterium]